MPNSERRSVNFSGPEVNQIDEVMSSAPEQRLLADLMASRQVSFQVASERLNSFSDAVRALAQLGLRELRKARRAELYRSAAEALAGQMDAAAETVLENEAQAALEQVLPGGLPAGAHTEAGAAR